jgi:hypothetical protein
MNIFNTVWHCGACSNNSIAEHQDVSLMALVHVVMTLDSLAKLAMEHEEVMFKALVHVVMTLDYC